MSNNQIDKIIELIEIEARGRRGPDLVSCIYAVSMEIGLGLSELMAAIRIGERALKASGHNE